MKKVEFYSIIKVSESTHELIKESGEEIAAFNGYIFYISKDRDCLKGGKGYTATDPATGCKLKHANTKKKLLEEMQDINFLDKISHAQTTEFYKNRVKEFKKLLKALQSPKNAPERKDHEEPKQAPEAERKDNQDMTNTAKAQHNEAKENAAPKAAERKEDNNTMTNTNAATEKQINLIKKLQEEKKTILIEDFNGLTKKTASAIIGKLIYKVKATQEEEKQTKEEETPAAPKAAEVVATVEAVQEVPTNNEEKDHIKNIIKNINECKNIIVTDTENSPIFYEGAELCGMKCSDLGEALEYITEDRTKYKNNIGTVARVEKVLNFQDWEEYNFFKNNLMMDWSKKILSSSTRNIGGSYIAKDNNFNEEASEEDSKAFYNAINYQNATSLQLALKGFKNITLCIAVQYQGENKFLIDTEGFNYCRYVGIFPAADYVRPEDRHITTPILNKHEEQELKELLLNIADGGLVEEFDFGTRRNHSEDFKKALELNGIKTKEDKLSITYYKA